MDISAFFGSVPYIVRMLLSLCVILVFQKLTKRLDIAMAVGILLLGFSVGHPAGAVASIAGGRLFSLETLLLALVVAGVIWLSELMSRSGIMKDLVVSLKARLSKRATLAVLPAVVGLLPMPGGALFSCPLLDDADNGNVIPPLMKTCINHWFRHVWEFWWPLYPGVLLALSLTELPVWKMALVQFPLYLAAIAAGCVFLLRKTPQAPPEPPPDGKYISFPSLIAPILTVVGVYAVLLAAVPALGRVSTYLPMLIGVAASLLVMQWQRPLPLPAWRKIILSFKWPTFAAIIVLARVYGAFIESPLPDGLPLMDRVRSELDAYGIPALLLVMLLPFVSGLTTGVTIGYIGASFPVVLSLAGDTAGSFFSTIVIAYACGFIGMMVSPIHVCLIVTNQHFHTALGGSMLRLLKPAAFVFVFAAAYSALWRALG